MKAWTQQEIQFVTERLEDATVSIYSDFLRTFGRHRSYDSVQKKTKGLRELRDEEDTEEEEVEEDTEDIQYYGYHPSLDEGSEGGADDPFVFIEPSEIRSRRQINKEKVLDWLLGVSEATQDYQVPLVRPLNSTKSSLVILLSDNHFGKQTPIFNLEVAKQRIIELPSIIAAKHLPPLDEIVVVLAGDMVEGEDIFPTQANELECPVIDQVQAATEAYWLMLRGFTEYFPECQIRVETCPGNHGRMSKTAHEKSNWDNVIYRQLGLLVGLAHEQRLNFANNLGVIVNCSPFKRFRVKDKWGLAYHHGVKHTGTAAMLSKLSGWDQSMPFDFFMHGHWHKWEIGTMFGKPIIKNGSLCGTDDFTLKIGAYDPSRQGFIVVTPGEEISNFHFVQW